MALTQQQIREVRNALVDEVFQGASCPFTKAELVAAVAAADDWATSNAASYNAALPQPFRSTASPEQKAALLMYVASKRYLG